MNLKKYSNDIAKYSKVADKRIVVSALISDFNSKNITKHKINLTLLINDFLDDFVSELSKKELEKVLTNELLGSATIVKTKQKTTRKSILIEPKIKKILDKNKINFSKLIDNFLTAFFNNLK